MSYISKVENDFIILQIKELVEEKPELLRYEMDRTSYPTIKLKDVLCCSGCNRPSTEVTVNGHFKKCIWRQSKKIMNDLFSELNRWEAKHIELIINELNE